MEALREALDGQRDQLPVAFVSDNRIDGDPSFGGLGVTTMNQLRKEVEARTGHGLWTVLVSAHERKDLRACPHHAFVAKDSGVDWLGNLTGLVAGLFEPPAIDDAENLLAPIGTLVPLWERIFLFSSRDATTWSSDSRSLGIDKEARLAWVPRSWDCDGSAIFGYRGRYESFGDDDQHRRLALSLLRIRTIAAHRGGPFVYDELWTRDPSGEGIVKDWSDRASLFPRQPQSWNNNFRAGLPAASSESAWARRVHDLLRRGAGVTPEMRQYVPEPKEVNGRVELSCPHDLRRNADARSKQTGLLSRLHFVLTEPQLDMHRDWLASWTLRHDVGSRG
jgi:hypothetical protein